MHFIRELILKDEIKEKIGAAFTGVHRISGKYYYLRDVGAIDEKGEIIIGGITTTALGVIIGKNLGNKA